MSFVENLVPRGRGRPPKIKEADQSPLEAALLEPLPVELLKAKENVENARNAVAAVLDLLRAAENDTTKVSKERGIEKARTELVKALARRDVAEMLGETGPSDHEIAMLEDAVEEAEANLSNHAPRIDALKKEASDRRQALRSAVEELARHIGIIESQWERIADAQLLAAATLISQVLQLKHMSETNGNVDPFTIDSYYGGDKHEGDITIPAMESIRLVFHVLRMGRSEMLDPYPRLPLRIAVPTPLPAYPALPPNVVSIS